MTRQEALAEARRRWGHNAYVQPARFSAAPLFGVGIEVCMNTDYPGRTSSWEYIRYGSGPSWEAAFKDADSLTRKD